MALHIKSIVPRATGANRDNRRHCACATYGGLVRDQVARFISDPKLMIHTRRSVDEALSIDFNDTFDRIEAVVDSILRASVIRQVTLDTVCYRLMRPRFPGLDVLFDDNLKRAGDISKLRQRMRVTGSAASDIVTAFRNPSPFGGPFNEGGLPAVYFALELDGVFAEVAHHLMRESAASGFTPFSSDFSIVSVRIRGHVSDIIDALSELRAEIDGRDTFVAGQVLGRAIRQLGSPGLIYPNSHHPRIQSVCLFSPGLVIEAEFSGSARLDMNSSGYRWTLGQ